MKMNYALIMAKQTLLVRLSKIKDVLHRSPGHSIPDFWIYLYSYLHYNINKLNLNLIQYILKNTNK